MFEWSILVDESAIEDSFTVTEKWVKVSELVSLIPQQLRELIRQLEKLTRTLRPEA